MNGRGSGSRGTVVILLLLAVSLFGVASAYAPRAHAQLISPPPSGSRVTAGILLVDVNQINPISGTFNADFYLWFNSTGSPQFVNYELVNGQATSVTVESNTTAYQEYRIRGSFVNNLNFADFPFENHTLSIQVESRNMQEGQLTFVPDIQGSGTDPSLVLNGWDLLASSISAAPHTYSGEQTFSRLAFSFTIGRPVPQTFMKDILPLILVVAIAMLSFALPPARSFERVFIGVTTLLAAVQFHVSLLSQIPAVNYLTLIDEVMLTVYGLILYGLGVTVLLARQVDRKDIERAWRLNRKGAILIPAVTVVVFGTLLLLAFLGF